MRRMIAASLGAAIVFSALVSAHHSYAAYDMKRLVEVDGTLEAFEWISPHSLLRVRSHGVLYSFEWRAAFAMERIGVQRDSLKAGDRLILTGNPRHDIDETGVVNLKSVLRPSDGWGWANGQLTSVASGSNR